MNFLDTPTEITLGALLLAIILTILAYWRIRVDKNIASLHLKRSVLTHSMGKPEWDLSKSWATSLTALGALLGTVISGGLSKNMTNAGLNLFFGVLVLIAPILYTTTARYIEIGTGDEKRHESQGFVGIFLLTNLIIVWAVLGELITVLIILYNVATTTILTSPIKYIFLIFLVAALVCVGAYVLRTLPWTVHDQLQTAQKETERLMTAVSREPVPEGEAPPRPAMKSWSLL
jgi:hypothetical protein